MPITYRIDARRSLVATTITGHIREAELRAHATAAAADPQVQACMRAIVDISQWVELGVDSKVVAALASGDVARIPGRQVAVIAPTDTTYGLSRVFQGFVPAPTRRRCGCSATARRRKRGSACRRKAASMANQHRY
jgi:hypothetical protein